MPANNIAWYNHIIPIVIRNLDKLIYIVMDYCDGGNLIKWLPMNKDQVNIRTIFDEV